MLNLHFHTDFESLSIKETGFRKPTPPSLKAFKKLKSDLVQLNNRHLLKTKQYVGKFFNLLNSVVHQFGNWAILEIVRAILEVYHYTPSPFTWKHTGCKSTDPANWKGFFLFHQYVILTCICICFSVLKSKFLKKTKRICIENPKFGAASICKINLPPII